MKGFFLICMLMFCTDLNAQSAFDKRFRIHAGFYYGFNTGQFNANSDGFLLNAVKNGIGGNFGVSKTFYNGFGGGVFVSTMTVYIDKAILARQLAMYYNAGDSYLIMSSDAAFQLSQLGFEIYKDFTYSQFTFEPLMRIGLGNLSGFDDVYVKIKKKNDNYFDAYTLSLKGKDEFEFFYSSLGGRISIPVSHHFHVFLAAMYTFGKHNFKLTEKKTNLFREQSFSESRFTQAFATVQTNFGVSLRLGKR